MDIEIYSREGHYDSLPFLYKRNFITNSNLT